MPRDVHYWFALRFGYDFVRFLERSERQPEVGVMAKVICKRARSSQWKMQINHGRFLRLHIYI